MWRTGKTYTLLGAVETSAATLEISLVASQRVKKKSSYNLPIPFLVMHPKDSIHDQRDAYTSIFTVVLLRVARK